tara:strand:- start:530 stop:910 length:381 start_codon:yes stop_codon:yes gene_type:complete
MSNELQMKDLSQVQMQSGLQSAGEWAGYAQKIPGIGNFLTPFAALAGMAYGHSEGDSKFQQMVRDQGAAKADATKNSLDVALAQNLSGAGTLPKPQPTQIVNAPEPAQSTQMTDQLNALNLNNQIT